MALENNKKKTKALSAAAVSIMSLCRTHFIMLWASQLHAEIVMALLWAAVRAVRAACYDHSYYRINHNCALIRGQNEPDMISH